MPGFLFFFLSCSFATGEGLALALYLALVFMAFALLSEAWVLLVTARAELTAIIILS